MRHTSGTFFIGTDINKKIWAYAHRPVFQCLVGRSPVPLRVEEAGGVSRVSIPTTEKVRNILERADSPP